MTRSPIEHSRTGKNLVCTFWSHKPSAIPVEDVAKETRSEPPQIVQELGHDDEDNNNDEDNDDYEDEDNV